MNLFIEHDTAGDGTFIPMKRFYLVTTAITDILSQDGTVTPNVPKPFAAGTVFRLRSDGANGYAMGHVFGWEE